MSGGILITDAAIAGLAAVGGCFNGDTLKRGWCPESSGSEAGFDVLRQNIQHYCTDFRYNRRDAKPTISRHYLGVLMICAAFQGIPGLR